jgi:hypothetical protein
VHPETQGQIDIELQDTFVGIDRQDFEQQKPTPPETARADLDDVSRPNRPRRRHSLDATVDP